MNRAIRNLFQHFYEVVGHPAPSIDLVEYALGERPYKALPEICYKTNNILKKMYLSKRLFKNYRAYTHITPDYHLVGHSPIYHGLNWDSPVRHEAFMQSCFDIHMQASEELMDAMFSEEAWQTRVYKQATNRWAELHKKILANSKHEGIFISINDNWEAELMESIEINRKRFQFWLNVRCFLLEWPMDPKAKPPIYIGQLDIDRPLLNIDTKTSWGYESASSPWDKLYTFGIDPYKK